MSPRQRWFFSKFLRFTIIAFLTLTMNFMLPRLMPGDPVENLLGEEITYIDPEIRAFLEAKYGLDKPLWVQYKLFLSSIFTLDFGYSISLSMNVNYLLRQRLTWTVLLLLPATLIGSVVSLFLATWSGMREGGIFDRVFSGFAIVAHTVPGFLIAMVFVRVFSFQLGWFPLGHLRSGAQTGWLNVLDIAYHLFLPMTVLALLIGSSMFLVLRNSVTQINDEYFIFVAKSKGLSERSIAIQHVMRNIMPVFLSLLALNIGFVVGGALLIEIVFSIQGMGSLLYEAVKMQDYPVIQAVFIILTTVVLAMNLVAEILYGLADPRVGDSIERGANN